MKKYTLTIIYFLLLTGFTVYMLLDTFVIPRAVAVAEPQTTVEYDTEPVSDDTKITISTYREYDTTIYVADIVLGSSDTIKTALAKGMYGKNIKDETSEIAEGVDAILAINGDFYGSRETGYCIRNGVLYRATANRDAEDLVIYSDGSFEIINESEITAEELLEKGVWQVLSFGPALVENGTVSVSESDEVGKAMASNPRTAICYMGENHYLFIVSDGRTDESEGLSL